MHGFGHGSHFVANLGVESCTHCNNTARRQCYASYSSQMMFGVTEYSYMGISIICPICHHGFSHSFAPLNSRIGKLFGGAEVKQKRADAERALIAMASEVDVVSTRAWYVQLGWLDKRRYRSMLEQLQLGQLLLTVVRGQ